MDRYFSVMSSYDRMEIIMDTKTTTFLIQSEAADFLRVSERSLERWRVEGTGPNFRRFGRRIVYATTDLI